MIKSATCITCDEMTNSEVIGVNDDDETGPVCKGCQDFYGYPHN